MITCTKFEQSYDTIKRLERVIKEHDRVVMGQGDGPIGEQNKVSIMWRLIDQRTKDRAMQRPELRLESRSSDAITAFLEELYVDEQIEMSHKKGAVAMDVSALSQSVGEEGAASGSDGRYTFQEWANYTGVQME